MTTQLARQAPAGRARRPAVSAAVPILASKVTAPGVPDWTVPRPRITELIAEGRRWCPLTAVTGPAGAGKTMALASWAAAEPGPVAWVTVDEFDDRPGFFWAHVVAALRRSGVAVPAVLSAGRGRDAGHGFLLGLAAVLAAQDPPVTVVLDDLHLLTGPEVLDGLGYVLRNTGPGLRLVVSARMDPPLPVHRYRLAGELTEIGAGDLAFTTAEAGELLARHGITLPADSLETLTRRTEGWAAGLRLAAISMAAHPGPDQFVTELITDDSALTGYLVAEVLNPQPPAVRDVLLNTSILEQVSAEAASEQTGNEQAPAILSALARANAFVQPAGSGWYRYHPLFAEVLRLKLKGEHPDQMAPLHRQAARWYERNGRLTDAVRHAARAGDWPLAAGIVIDQLAIGQIIQPRGSPSLAGQFAGMPHGRAWTGPAPQLVSAAVALSAGRHESSIAALDAADGIFARLPADQEVAGRLAAAMIRLAASRRTGDLAAAAAAAARAEAPTWPARRAWLPLPGTNPRRQPLWARRAPPSAAAARRSPPPRSATPRASWPGAGASSPTPNVWSARPPCNGTVAATGWTPATASSSPACSPRPASDSPTPPACWPPPERPVGRCSTWPPDSPSTATRPHMPPARPGTYSATTGSPRHRKKARDSPSTTRSPTPPARAAAANAPPPAGPA